MERLRTAITSPMPPITPIEGAALNRILERYRVSFEERPLNGEVTFTDHRGHRLIFTGRWREFHWTDSNVMLKDIRQGLDKLQRERNTAIVYDDPGCEPLIVGHRPPRLKQPPGVVISNEVSNDDTNTVFWNKDTEYVLALGTEPPFDPPPGPVAGWRLEDLLVTVAQIIDFDIDMPKGELRLGLMAALRGDTPKGSTVKTFGYYGQGYLIGQVVRERLYENVFEWEDGGFHESNYNNPNTTTQTFHNDPPLHEYKP